MGLRKDKFTNRERELMRYTHLEEYLFVFLKQYSRPTKRWPKVEEALEEVARERLLLAAEMEGTYPGGLRRRKVEGV